MRGYHTETLLVTDVARVNGSKSSLRLGLIELSCK